MRKGGGKQKGAAFERQVCKDLSLWLSGGKSKDLFWRSAMSGGRSTVAYRKGDKLSAQAGDISSVHKLGHAFTNNFIVECKFYKDLNFGQTFIKQKGKLLDFWLIAIREAEKYNKLPILIAKQNNYPTVVCLTDAGVQKLNCKNELLVLLPNYGFNVILFEAFLELDPKFVTSVKRKKLRR